MGEGGGALIETNNLKLIKNVIFVLSEEYI